MREILGLRRGEDGAFCHGIPGFLGWSRVRCGDSAHGGQCRAVGAKKFLKIFKKRGEKPGNWGARGGAGVPGCISTGVRDDFWVWKLGPLAALLGVRFV